MLKYPLTDAELIASVCQTPVARRQYEVYFHGDSNAQMMVWADNKAEAKDIAREYAARIMRRSFNSIVVA